MNRRLRAIFAAAACASLLPTYLWSQTSAPDIRIFEWGDLGAPTPAGHIYVRIEYTGTNSTTVDGVVYRGSLAGGNAVEMLRKPVTFTPGSLGLFDTGYTVPLNEGDVFSFCINPNQSVAESNYKNNCQERVVSAKLSNLAVSVGDMSIAPVGAAVGAPLTVNARVRNKSDNAARALVRLFQKHPQDPAAMLLGQATVSVPANGSAVASWTVTRPAGDANLWIGLEDVYPRDIQTSDNLASRSIFLKAIVDTGRRDAYLQASASLPAVGDLLGTGQPVMLFAEYPGGGTANAEARITAAQLFNDGTHKELWSKSGFLPSPAEALAPAVADIDGDGQPEIVFEAVTRPPSGQTGQIGIFVLNKDGSLKWQHKWDTVGRGSCHSAIADSKPALGDMNGDGIADIVVLETELIVLDGRNGNELMRKPGIYNSSCSQGAYSAIADLDGDGKNEYIVGDYGIHVFNNNGSLRWEYGGNNLYAFALLDLDKDARPEIVVPVHRQFFLILDAATGKVKQQKVPSNAWSPFAWTIGATTSVDPNGYPTLAIANNDYVNGTGVLDNNLNQKWYDTTPAAKAGNVDNPSHIALADLLGQGRPQIISRSDRRSVGIQDIVTGAWLEYFDIVATGAGYNYWPIPVDADGDGRGEIVVQAGAAGQGGPYDPSYPVAQYLVFGSDQWQKIPHTWNQYYFVPNQVDQNLAFKHDYQPWKTHNTWFQQPLRKPCDVDFDDDVDQNDINAITAARGTAVQPGDWRDYDKDGTITVNDARACTLRCTSTNCAAINPPAHILSVSPRQAFPGSTVNVTIRGEFLKFKAGQVTADFGSGVSVSNIKVIDADNMTATVTVAQGQSGDRTVTITSGSVSASRPSAFSLSAGNNPPAVHAGPDQQLVLPGSITLNGTVTDDGQPFNQLTYSWQVVAGPGTATIASPNTLTTSVAFSKEGFYVLRLSASDGQYFANDDVGVVAIQGNQAPYVSAGQGMTVPLDAPAIVLQGDVQDDGLPYGSTVTRQWSKVSGPGNVTFSSPQSAITNVTFSSPGEYVLSLTASDGQLTNSASVTVLAAPPAPRILSVGPDSAAPGQTRTITLTTRYTHFTSGTTQANFGPGVSVGGSAPGSFGPVTVVDATTATVQVTVSADAALGVRTVTVSTGSEQASKTGAFTVGAIGAPYTVRPNLTYGAIAPGESVDANPQVVDAAGNVISGPQTFTMTVAPKAGAAMGNPPLVNGLTATFPKLSKRLVGQDPVADPAGEYADGDPGDPNYGKETGGIYTVELTLNGSAVKGSADLVVLPGGTAGITLRALRFGTDLGTALDAAIPALTNNDATGIAAVKAALAGLSQNLDYSAKLLAANNVMAPVNAFPLTYAQVAARFSPAADDAAYGGSVGSAITEVRLIRARIDGITAATLSQADLDALKAAAATYKSLVAQRSALKPGPLGVTAAGDQMNKLLSRELPMLLDSITRKSAELLAALPSTGASAQTATLDRALAAHLAGSIDQYLTLFSNLFSIFTDVAGVAKSDIIELVASLANDLINIGLTNVINDLNVGAMNVDFVSAGGQFSFACPNWMNTYVEGDGFSPILEKNSVAVIGCINSYLLRNLLTLKPSKDLASSIRLFFKIKSVAEAMGKDQSIAANADPDQLREGLFGGSEMVFSQGWPRVNQGRLPCVGIVIVFNFETGAFQAVNVNMLPSCQ